MYKMTHTYCTRSHNANRIETPGGQKPDEKVVKIVLFSVLKLFIKVFVKPLDIAQLPAKSIC
jgi:hypothetical protein